MIHIEKKEKCCGCGACMNVCPKQCIAMQEDDEGFLYPKVNKDVCVNCGLCEKICPVMNPREGISIQESYTLVSKDNDVLYNSASGGSFYALASSVIASDGVVFGAAFDNDMVVCHQHACDKAKLMLFSGSKYVQSSIGKTFSTVKTFLKAGKMVLFSGTPCQIQGLYNYLGNFSTENLITLDFVCHGTPSPKVLRKYFDYVEKKYGGKIADYKFRTKKYGYNSNNFCCCCLSDGREIWGDEEDEYISFMTKSFFSEITSRPSCAACVFKSNQHISDFTAFDCWHWKTLSKTIDGKMGATTLVVNSSKGKNILNKIADSYYLEKSDLAKAIRLDGISMLYSIPPHPCRSEFFESLSEKSIPELYDKFLKLKGKNKAKAMMKKVLDMVGILLLLRNLKYRLKK